jgi:hypothetical protein
VPFERLLFFAAVLQYVFQKAAAPRVKTCRKKEKEKFPNAFRKDIKKEFHSGSE